MMRRSLLIVAPALVVLCFVVSVSGQELLPDAGQADSGVSADAASPADAGVATVEAEAGAPVMAADAAPDADDRQSEADAEPASELDADAQPATQPDAASGSEAAPSEGDGGLSTEVDPSHGLADDEMWIFIDKSERRMVVNDGRGWRESFRIALGQNPEGDKRWEGDGRTPEGDFFVCRRIIHNRFHRFLGVSYPGPADAEYGKRRRWLQPIEYRSIHRAHRLKRQPPWTTKLGGNIGIHGYGVRRDRAKLHARGEDWTDGCIAVTNEEIERIYDHTKLKTRVLIVP